MRKPFTGVVALIAILAVLAPWPVSAQTATTSSLIVKLVAGLSPEQQAQVIARTGGIEISAVPALRLHVIEVLASELADVLARYQSDPEVASVEENKRRQWQLTPSDALYIDQWALPKIGWDLVYGAVNPAGSATVALLDSGIDGAHPDLAGKVVPGTSILDGSNGLVDPSGHGTALAGIIAASTGSSEGMAGVGFAGVRVTPVSVLNASGEGWDSDVIAGVVWAADHGADVILMAFSNPGFSQNLQDAIDYAWSRGVVLVAAVGNNAENAPTFPAGHRGVVGVSATDSADSLAAFSNFGTATFLAAPGVDIPTTWIGDSYTVVSGTSTSAAIVAGVAAFMKAVDPTLSNGIIVGRMARMADPAGTQEQTGNGRVNMARAAADTGTDFIQPAGADPVGAGGPFVGPYVAANLKLQISGNPDIVAPPGATDKIVNTNQSFTVQVTISNNNNNVDASRTWSGVSATLTVPSGWSKSSNLTGATLGAATAGGSTTPCGAAVTTTACTFSWTVTASGTPATGHSISVTVAGTPSPATNICGSSGNQCSDTKAINGIAVVNPAALTITGVTAEKTGSPGIATVTSGDSISLSITVANGAAPGAAALHVSPSTVTITPTGTATATCPGGWSPASANIPAGATQTFTRTCGSISGSGSLTFAASASGTDENSGGTVSAGTTTSNPVTVIGDTTPPVITPNVNGTPGNHDWYTTNVTVTWTVTDPDSTITSQTGCDSTTISSDTAGTTLTCSATSAGGIASQSVTIKRDATSPTISGSRSPAANTHGWNNTDVIVTFTCDDATSGILFCTDPQKLSTEGASQSVTGTAKDNAGNTNSATVSGINIDKTPPTVTPTVTGTLGNNGWYTSNVTVSWTVADGLSGVASSTGCVTTSITSDTAGQTLTCSATDKADNSTTQSVTIKRDATSPTISGNRAPAANAYGWNNSDVTVTFTCTDATSGIATCSPSQTASAEGAGQSVTGAAQDNAGNTASATVSGINIDKTAPTVAVAGFNDGQIFYTGGGPLPTVGCSATDALSGVDAIGSPVVLMALNGNGVGAATYRCSATDKAGNTGTDTRTYYVRYGGVSGILQPINPDNTSVFNRGKAVPIKFRLAGDEYTGFNTAAWKLQRIPVSCTSFDAADATYEDVGSVTPFTVFRYDAAADQYIYNADFRDKAAGTCWRVRVTLDDGTLDDSATTMESATFRLQK